MSFATAAVSLPTSSTMTSGSNCNIASSSSKATSPSFECKSSAAFDSPFGHNWSDLLREFILPNTDEQQQLQAFLETLKSALTKISGVIDVELLGSVGKQTHVKNNNEMDIGVLVNSLNVDNRASWIAKFKQAINSVGKKFTVSDTTRFSIEVKTSNLKADVLPIERLPQGPLSFLGFSLDERKLYSASAGPYQRDFVKNQPELYHNFVRVVKWWRGQQEWTDPKWRPRSYLIELICLYVFHQFYPNIASLPPGAQMNALFRQFLTLVEDLPSPCASVSWICFNAYYSSELARPFANAAAGINGAKTLSVMDVGNPTNDMGHTLEDWQQFSILCGKTRRIMEVDEVKAFALRLETMQQILDENKKQLEALQKENMVLKSSIALSTLFVLVPYPAGGWVKYTDYKQKFTYRFLDWTLRLKFTAREAIHVSLILASDQKQGNASFPASSIVSLRVQTRCCKEDDSLLWKSKHATVWFNNLGQEKEAENSNIPLNEINSASYYSSEYRAENDRCKIIKLLVDSHVD